LNVKFCESAHSTTTIIMTTTTTTTTVHLISFYSLCFLVGRRRKQLWTKCQHLDIAITDNAIKTCQLLLVIKNIVSKTTVFKTIFSILLLYLRAQVPMLNLKVILAIIVIQLSLLYNWQSKCWPFLTYKDCPRIQINVTDVKVRICGFI